MEILHKNPYGDEIYTLRVDIAKYQNGQTAIKLFDVADGFPYATASLAIDGVLQPDEVAIKNYSENEGVLHSLISAKVVAKPHRFKNQGYVQVPICKLLITV